MRNQVLHGWALALLALLQLLIGAPAAATSHDHDGQAVATTQQHPECPEHLDDETKRVAAEQASHPSDSTECCLDHECACLGAQGTVFATMLSREALALFVEAAPQSVPVHPTDGHLTPVLRPPA